MELIELKIKELFPMPLRSFTSKPAYTDLLDHELVYVVVGGVRRLVVRHGTGLYACVMT